VTAALEVSVTTHIGAFELDVAFSVESGISVLFGPSGAGKTLTLALIAGLIRPDSGTVEINGVVVSDGDRRIHASTQSRRVGMVFQDGLLLPHRSVLDNVALAVRQSNRRQERRAVARSWLQRVGAGGLANRRPGSLSGGQRQRVALARGLAGDPALVLLDEPLSALDSAVRHELRVLIREVIVSSGIPAVLVTHDAEEAEKLGDAVISYNDGRVTGTRVIDRAADPDGQREAQPGTGSA
jgi:molybdate transport system ATP-binding protein